jgi:hypothetical protein
MRIEFFNEHGLLILIFLEGLRSFLDKDKFKVWSNFRM